MGAYCQKARLNKVQECLTDRQVTLARTIVGKYRRQLLEKGVVLPDDVNAIPLRHNVRAIDRTQGITANIEEKTFTLKFPYSPQKISTLHNYTTTDSAGKIEWDNKARTWTFDLTEGNIKTVLDLFKSEDLKIDDSIAGYVEDVMRANPTQLPRIVYENNQLVLQNCHQELLEYIADNEIDLTNIINSVAYISCLGVNIDDTVVQHLTNQFGYDVARIICDRRIVMPSGNQPDGPWHTTLLKANQVLKDVTWVLYLTWWSDKTNWSEFQNITNIKASRSFSNVDEAFVNIVENKDTIVVMDSVVGSDAIKNYIEHKALKVIYISDIGSK